MGSWPPFQFIRHLKTILAQLSACRYFSRSKVVYELEPYHVRQPKPSLFSNTDLDNIEKEIAFLEGLVTESSTSDKESDQMKTWLSSRISKLQLRGRYPVTRSPSLHAEAGLMGIANYFNSNKKEWKELAIYLASFISDLAMWFKQQPSVTPGLERDFNGLIA